ncbi:MAG: histidinol-phosphatase [Lachnospiraceae bacterium]|nr:histidinol-phosphatase [Lachnospiraceae bacterium]
MTLADIHVHTPFSDGYDTAEDVVQEAIRRGMDVIGFSEHSYTDYDTEWCMPEACIPKYREEILRLREKYRGKIRILHGLEFDYYSEEKPEDYDYTIGSVHYVKAGNEYLTVDGGREKQQDGIRRYFGGDPLAFAEAYYKIVADVVRKTHCDVIGHFDLVVKFNEKDPYIDTEDPRYKAAWRSALDALIPLGKPFEINVGAIARGYTTDPYPSREIREEIAARGGKLFLTSDSHVKETLMYRFDEFRKLETVDVGDVIRGFRGKA